MNALFRKNLSDALAVDANHVATASDTSSALGDGTDRARFCWTTATCIWGNAGDGIRALRNAGVDIGTDATGATPQFDDDTNVGTNAGFGIRCMIAGFVDGRLGSLTGTSGGKSFAEACLDSVVQ